MQVQSTELSRFLRDANGFVASSQEAIERSAPHIYLSALPLTAKSSLVYREFAPPCRGLIEVGVFGIEHHAGQLVMSFTGHEAGVNCIAYSPDGRLIGSGSADGTVRVWDIRTGEEAISPLRSGDGSVQCLMFAPKVAKVASGKKAGVVCIWQLLGVQAIPQRLIGHSGSVQCMAFSPDGSRIASSSGDCTVRIWNIDTDQAPVVMRGHTKRVNSVAFSSNGEALVSVSDDQTIRHWDGVTGKRSSDSPVEYEDAIGSVCFSPDGKMIAVACEDCIVLSNLKTGNRISTLQCRIDTARSVAFSPDSRSLVLGREQSVSVVSLPRFRTKVTPTALDGHTSQVNSVTYSPDGL